MKKRILKYLCTTIFIYLIINIITLAVNIVEANNNGENINIITKNISDGVELRYCATIGGRKINSDEEVNEGQVIKYEISIINNSDNDINNLDIIAQYKNAVFYGKEKESTLINELDENSYKTSVDMDYDTLTNESTKSFPIEVINKKSTYTFCYELKIRKNNAFGENLEGTITINSDLIKNKTIKTIDNKIKKGDISLDLFKPQYSDYKYGVETTEYIELYVENTSDTDIKNQEIIIPLKNNIKVFNVSKYYKDRENESLDYKIENDKLIINLDFLALKTSQQVEIVFTIEEFDNGSKDFNLNAFTKVNDCEYYSNEVNEKVEYYKSNFKVEQIIKNDNDILKDGDVIKIQLKIINDGEQEDIATLMTDFIEGFKITNIKKIVNQNTNEINGDEEDNLIDDSSNLKVNEEVNYEIEAKVMEELVNDNIAKFKLKVAGTNNLYEMDEISYDLNKSANEIVKNEKQINVNIIITVLGLFVLIVIAIIIKKRRGKYEEKN